MRAEPGDWVQIASTVLEPGKRSPQVPPDTQAVPLEMRLKGFATSSASLGEEIVIRTVTGRVEKGILVSINPGYPHGFGRPVPELLTIGQELRRILRGEGDAR
jgi:hypothetical protein